MAELNLGKVVGSDAKINGQTAITLTGANGVSVVTSGTDVTVDGAGIKTELTTHTSNTDIHVTTKEKASWNGKAELTDIPSSLPANGGNADTVGGLHANEIASNPNLLINPDFSINQRAQTEYTITGFTVDHWFSQRFFTITPITTGIRIVPAEAISENLYSLCQKVPISTAMCGNDYTLTINVATTNDYAHAAIYAYNAANSVVKSSDKIKLQTGVNSVTIKKLPDTTAYIRVQFTINSGAQPSDVLEVSWAKLELGSIATPFTPPDPATELAKCQRYAIQLINGVQATVYRLLTNMISFYYPLPTTLRNAVTSTAEFVICTGNNVEQSDFTFAFYPKPNGIIIEATKSAHGITLADNPILVVKKVGIFDAEL